MDHKHTSEGTPCIAASFRRDTSTSISAPRISWNSSTDVAIFFQRWKNRKFSHCITRVCLWVILGYTKCGCGVAWKMDLQWGCGCSRPFYRANDLIFVNKISSLSSNEEIMKCIPGQDHIIDDRKSSWTAVDAIFQSPTRAKNHDFCLIQQNKKE